MEDKFKIAVFIDFDNIEIGVKSTLQREFDVAAVLDALKERGEIVTKIAYANWGRQETSTRALAEHAVQMVQRDPSPRGDNDFIALVNKLKQYAKRIFVVSGRAFTSTILQKNCHEFISYESLLEETRPARDRDRPREPQQAHQQGQQPSGQQPQDAQQGHQRQHNRRPA